MQYHHNLLGLLKALEQAGIPLHHIDNSTETLSTAGIALHSLIVKRTAEIFNTRKTRVWRLVHNF